MSEIPVQHKRSTGLLIWLIVSQLLAAASTVVSVMIMAMYGMGYQEVGLPPYWQYWIALCYPIFPLTMSIGAWVAFARRRNMVAAILSGLSLALVPVLLFINPYA